MLRQAQIKAVIEGVEKLISVEEAFNIYNNSVKKGGLTPIQLQCYNPNSKKFSFQTPTIFKPLNAVSKVMTIELDMSTPEDKDVICKIIIDTTSKILIKTNGQVTSVQLGNFTALTGKRIEVGYVDREGKVVFKPLKKVYDPLDPSKSKEAKNPAEFTVVRAETRDGSYFVCDGLIIK